MPSNYKVVTAANAGSNKYIKVGGVTYRRVRDDWPEADDTTSFTSVSDCPSCTNCSTVGDGAGDCVGCIAPKIVLNSAITQTECDSPKGCEDDTTLGAGTYQTTYSGSNSWRYSWGDCSYIDVYCNSGYWVYRIVSDCYYPGAENIIAVGCCPPTVITVN